MEVSEETIMDIDKELAICQQKLQKLQLDILLNHPVYQNLMGRITLLREQKDEIEKAEQKTQIEEEE